MLCVKALFCFPGRAKSSLAKCNLKHVLYNGSCFLLCLFGGMLLASGILWPGQHVHFFWDMHSHDGCGHDCCARYHSDLKVDKRLSPPCALRVQEGE